MSITKRKQSSRAAVARPARRSRSTRRDGDGLAVYEQLVPIPADVRAFLAERPQLNGVLEAAAHEIKTFFPDAVLSLMIEDDVDLGPEPGVLIMARTKVPFRDRYGKLLELHRGWWYDMEAEHGGAVRLADFY